MLNPLGDQLPAHASRSSARVVWGARTLRGADALADEWKYVPVRRLALFLEESLYRGTQWVVFEPNDEPLWAQIRLNVGAFMHDLFRQGAFQGTHAARGLLRQVRQRDDHAERHQPGHRQHRGRLRAAEAGRVRGRSRSSRWRGQIADLRRSGHGRSSPSTRQRFDPYKNFKFRVKWDGRYVAGVSKVSALKRTHRGGQAPRRRRPEQQPQVAGPHQVRGDHAGARRHPRHRSSSSGPTRSGTSAPGSGAEVSLTDFRKDIIIEVYNEAGQLAHRLQGLPLLGVGVPGAARPRRQRQRGRHPDTSSSRTRAGSATTR